MRSKRVFGICNCVALYDWDPETTDLKGWFQYMETWAEEIGQPWESIGLGLSIRLMQFKNGKRKFEKMDFQGTPHILLLGGVSEPGTNSNWKTYASFSNKENNLRKTLELCFSDDLAPFSKEILKKYLQSLLTFADFKYGICYQRGFNFGPADYASGTIGVYSGFDISREEEDRIGAWSHEYEFSDGSYRTGLLRDVYPFNILVDTHLTETVGDKTLEAWIDSDSTHGTLEKITDTHWLWSIDAENIPAAQEALQKAGLLLCYKV